MKEEEIEAEDKRIVEIALIIARLRILMEKIDNNTKTVEINSLRIADMILKIKYNISKRI